MKRTVLFISSLFYQIISFSQTDLFEVHYREPRNSSVRQLNTLGDGMAVRLHDNSSRIMKYNSLGQLLGYVTLPWEGSSPVRFKNSFMFSYQPADHCDYMVFDDFILKRYNSDLTNDISLSDDSFANNPFEADDWNIIYDAVNDSLLVFVTTDKFIFMDLVNVSYPVNIHHDISGHKGILSITTDSIWIYGSQGISLYNGESITHTAFTPIKCLKSHFNKFYGLNNNTIYVMDSLMNVEANVLIEGFSLLQDILFYDDLIFLIAKQQNLEYLIAMDGDLNIVSNTLIPESQLIEIETFIIAENKLFVGGRAGSNDMVTGCVKSHAIDLTSQNYVQDIGVESVEILDCRFFPTSSLGIGNYPINNVRFDANVVVRNYTDQPIHNAWLVHIPTFVGFEWCWTTTYYYLIDTIAPLSFIEMPIINAHNGTRHGAAQGTVVGINACFRTHAPNNRIDDMPQNDKLCRSESVIFVNTENYPEKNPINCFYNPTQDHIEIRNVNDAHLQLYSASGRLLESRTLLRGDNQLPMDKYSSGIYLVRVETNDSVSVVKIGKP